MKKDPVLYSKSFYALIAITPIAFAIKFLFGIVFGDSSVYGVVNFIGFALFIAAFIQDRNQLKASGKYYCPHWGWYFLAFVYIYKRTQHNGMGIGWFVTYFILNIALPVMMSISVIVAFAYMYS